MEVGMQLAILDYKVAVSLGNVFLGPQLGFRYRIQLVPSNQLPAMHQATSSKITDSRNNKYLTSQNKFIKYLDSCYSPLSQLEAQRGMWSISSAHDLDILKPDYTLSQDYGPTEIRK